MCQPFIRNHQYNQILKQAKLLQKAFETGSDPKVTESVRESALIHVMEAFPDATETQKQTLEQLVSLRSEEQFRDYMRSLEPLMEEFSPVTEQQLKKLFPKVKKLKVPDLSAVDFRYVTYLGWTDVATGKLFLVYRLDGRLVGIEGRFTPANKKGACFLCRRQEEVALFTAVTKSRPAGASPDYYKAIGNYMCTDSEVCNRNLTDTAILEKFVRDVTDFR
ncbi:FusB/FusC family EF-G-binding protein [Cohnella zeiphila]|uniref:FusB/FusC family EF-G-binding protein n=1 Tax=Cohnella zeiphila TaxID=2761120 RepID=A0A7X0ST29_9BACL|nr:FusB/FusC family EF-G-binding protein [Cohnella zeiphila]MBB6734370.1 FusB/FusC family EF-G-binding protein [Cohnella zeiphila]